jgi:cell wall assembly regulator SMI1
VQLTRLRPLARLLGEEQLLRFEALLREHDVPIDEWTRPGLDDADIDLAISPLGLRLPREARIWWRWRDGTIYGGQRKLPGPWYMALSIEGAVDQYLQLRQVAKNSAPDWPQNDPDIIWSPSWLPIIRTAQPIAIDCSVPLDAPTPVLHVDFTDLDRSLQPRFNVPRASSLGEMVGWWIMALETDIWYWDESDGWWRTRRERLASALRTNPLV